MIICIINELPAEYILSRNSNMRARARFVRPSESNTFEGNSFYGTKAAARKHSIRFECSKSSHKVFENDPNYLMHA